MLFGATVVSVFLKNCGEKLQNRAARIMSASYECNVDDLFWALGLLLVGLNIT